ncbi:MAG TPA: hypothetical protein VFF74_04395 [Methylophilaceae bacterium]|nr:hypothetical protein [Methylophilaceae bacterium]
MAKLYLQFNAVLYLLFVLWCTVKREQTAAASGYMTLSNSGWCEYLVIYGGLQLGLAAFYGYTAYHPPYHWIALLFSILIYSAIALYRIGFAWAYWPVSKLTIYIAALEILLLIGALIIFAYTPEIQR